MMCDCLYRFCVSRALCATGQLLQEEAEYKGVCQSKASLSQCNDSLAEKKEKEKMGDGGGVVLHHFL